MYVCILGQSVSSTTDTPATSQLTGISHPQSRRTNLEEMANKQSKKHSKFVCVGSSPIAGCSTPPHLQSMPRPATVLIPSRRQEISATSHGQERPIQIVLALSRFGCSALSVILKGKDGEV